MSHPQIRVPLRGPAQLSRGSCVDAIDVGAALAALGRGSCVDAIDVGAALAALSRGSCVDADRARASPRLRKQAPTGPNAFRRAAPGKATSLSEGRRAAPQVHQ